MTDATPYILVALVALLNLPFGAWRVTTARYSLLWFLAIHVPIPLVIVVRLAMGYGYWLVPFLVAGAVAGQIIGARLFAAWRSRRRTNAAAGDSRHPAGADTLRRPPDGPPQD